MPGPNTDRRLPPCIQFVSLCGFVLDPAGVGLLLKGSLAQTRVTVVSAVIGVAALAGGVQNWLLIQADRAERPMLIAAGLLLVYPGVVTDSAGLVLIVAVVLMQKLRSR